MGSNLTVTHTMEARHPGDCYLYISYDGANPINFFKIAALKGCGAPNGLDPPTPYTATIDLPAALPPCDHCVLRWEWTAHQQVSDIEFYVQCADIKIESTAGPTMPSPMVAIAGIGHLPSDASSYRNPYNGEFGDQWLIGPNVASFSPCNAGSAGCIGAGGGASSTTASSMISSTTGGGATSTTRAASTVSAPTGSTSRSTSAATSVSSGAPGTTTLLPSTTGGSCDQTCEDSLGSAACRPADAAWNMCSAGGSWWTSGCHATCDTCGSGLPPCGQCDHKCTNIKSDTECGTKIQESAGALCSGGWGAWWLDQCRLACGACDGTPPPCSTPPSLPSEDALAFTGSNSQGGGQTGLAMSSCFKRILHLLPLAVTLALHA